MKLLKIIVLFFYFSLSQAYAETSLTQLLKNIQTMQADFSQTTLNKSAKPMQKSMGKMALHRPGKFRWEVVSPISQLIVANGKKLWIYDKDLEQVTIRSLSSAAGETPALLLSDSTLSLEKDFYVKPSKQAMTGVQSFLLLPKDQNSLFVSIRLAFKGENLSEMQLQNGLGQTTIIRFFNNRINGSLSDSLFQMNIPYNVDVIDETRRH